MIGRRAFLRALRAAPLVAAAPMVAPKVTPLVGRIETTLTTFKPERINWELVRRQREFAATLADLTAAQQRLMP